MAVGGLAEVLRLAEIERFPVGPVLLWEVELLLPLLGVEHDGGIESAPEFAAEALQRADPLFHEQGDDLLALQLAARHAFPDEQLALGIDALVGLEALLEALAAALGAGDFEVVEVPLHDRAHPAAHLAHDVSGQPPDFVHESRARELAALHLAELEFPFAGQLRLGQRLGVQAAQQGDEGDALCRDDEVAPLPDEVALVDQTLDDLRTRGRGAEPALAHGLAQFLVVHQFARAFHGGKQRAFVVAGRRLGLAFLHLHGLGFRAFARRDGDDRLVGFALPLGLLPIDREPARIDDDFAVRLEFLPLDGGDARRHLELRRRIKHRDEPPRDEIVNLRLRLAQPARHGARRDDGKVVADFRVVKDALVRMHQPVAQRLVGMHCERAVGEAAHHALRGGHMVLREVAGVRPRVGERLVLFVKRLRDLERHLRGKAVPPVRLSLERGEVVEQRRRLARRLLFLLDRAGLAVALGLDRVRFLPLPDALGAVLFGGLFKGLIEPAPAVAPGGDAKIAEDLEVSPRLECADFFLPVHEDGQRGRLHAARGGLVKAAALRVEGGEGARGIDPHEPVGLGARKRGVRERLHVAVGAEIVEGSANRLGRHGLEPEAAERLLHAGGPDDVPKDQLALAPGVAGIDDGIDFLPLEQALEDVEPAHVFVDG